MALSGQSRLAEGRPFAWGTARPPPALPPHSLLVKLQPVQKGGDRTEGRPLPQWVTCP